MAATPEHAARVLGLNLEASLDDVRRVRREMAFKYHPDRSEDLERSTRHMARINAAVDTLTAHIKQRTRSKPKGNYRSDPVFSTRKRAGKSSTRDETPNRTSSTKNHNAEKSEQESQSHTRGQTGQTVGKFERPSTKSRGDIARIRFASASYASVLDRIGRKALKPQIDVSILSFQGAH